MKNALVTGSSRGIGRGIALALADKGFNIVVNGRSDNEIMDRTCAEIETKGVTAVKIPSDVSDPTQHARLIPTA